MLSKVLTVANTVTCRWEITVLIILQAGALYVFGQVAVDRPTPLLGLFGVGLFGLFAQGLCSVLNDIMDLETDKINHPERPLPSCKVSIQEAQLVVVGCLVGSLACGWMLSTSLFAGVALAIHLVTSIAYSFPGIRFGRHWLMGPMILATSTVFGILFILSCTAIYSTAPFGRNIVLLIATVCFLQHLFVIPLKDVTDIKGDASVGGSSLAMKISRRTLLSIAIAGYLLPWVVLYAGADVLAADAPPSLVLALQTLAGIFFVAGIVMSWLILTQAELLSSSKRFGWIAELGLVILFQIALPFAIFAFRT